MDAQTIISILSEYISQQRRERMETVLAWRTRYITVLLENIYQSQNASAVLRTCDCFGIQDVHVIENTNLYQINPMVVKGSDQWLNIHKFNQAENNSLYAVKYLKSNGYRIIATRLNDESVSLTDFDLSKGKCALVFGNEHQGVSDIILQEADEYLKIPMHGFTQSLNISVSAGIILSYLTQEIQKIDIEWSLPPKEKNALLSEWLKKTIKDSELILQQSVRK